MASVLDAMAAGAWSASWHGAVAVAVVLLVRGAMGRRLSAGWRCALWALVAVRLCMPVGPAAPVSLFGALEGGHARGGAAAATGNDRVRVKVAYGGVAAMPLTAGGGLAWGTAGAGPSATHWLSVAWVMGGIVMLSRTAVGWARVGRIIAAGEVITEALVVGELAACAARLGVRRRVRLVRSGAVGGPAAAGVWRPVILMPPGLLGELSPRELSFVFLHELAHVKRWDSAVEWLIAGLTAVHWFNPLAWVAARLYRADRELARDAMVLRASSAAADERQGYGATLLRLVEALPRRSGAAGVVGMVGMLWPDGRLRERVRRIAGFSAARRPGSVVLGAVAVAIVGCSTLTDGRKRNAPATAPASGTAPAVTTTTLDGPADEVITRVYDVRDLLVDVPDFDSRQGFPDRGEGPTATRPAPPLSEKERAAQLMTLIRETVNPTTWRPPDVPGLDYRGRDRLGVIREHFGNFVVTQRRSEHRDLVALLAHLRETRGVQIMIETRFISIAKADAARLPDEVRGRLAGVGEAAHGDAGAGAFMDDAQVAALIKAVSAHAATETLAAPRVLLFNGQKAYVMVGTQTAYVADLKVVRSKADPTAVSYEPDVQVANDGLVVDFQATVSADREQVTMTLNPRLTRLLRIETVPFDKVPADARGERPSVQRPVMATSEIATTVTVPNGRTVVLATNGPLPKGARGEKGPEAAAQSDQLLLMLAKPRVIVQAAVDGKARP